MVLPSRRFLYLLAVPVVPLLLAPRPGVLALAVAWNVALAALFVLDARLSPTPRDIEVTRLERERLSLRAPATFGWTVRNRSPHAVHLELLDDLPASLSASEPTVRATLEGQSHADLGYAVRPTVRGRHVIGDVHVRFASRLGLVTKQARLPASTLVKVYPNVARIGARELGGGASSLRELGARRSASRGEGSEFEGLRDYVIGDSPSDIAWKATARRGRAITRTYQVDRSRSVLLVLDCGRLMTTEVAGATRLDHAIDGAVRLSHATVKQGDTIGLLAFSDVIEAYVPPVRGNAALGRISDALYELQPRPRESSYERAGAFLALRHRKRSLIVIVTDVIDGDASSALLAHAARFARRHVVLSVSLRNLDLEHLAASDPANEAAAYAGAAAADLLLRRRVAIERLRRSGVDILDVDPRELGPRMITKYLELKRRLRI